MKALAQILFEISCTQDFQILFSKGYNSEKGHNLDMKKIWVNYFFMRNLYMKFQNPIIHCSKVSNFTKKWENQSKFKNSVFLSSSQKLIRSSTHQPQPVTYYSRYLAHKIFKFCFQREITQRRSITRTRKKYESTIFS